MDKTGLGSWGEERAAAYLRRHGYHILDRNYRCRLGEIDIIASRRNTVAFVEVKLRKNSAHGEAREFVTGAKQGRIIRTAQLWIAEHEGDYQPRFDVIEIYAPEGMETRRPEIHHLEDAFQL